MRRKDDDHHLGTEGNRETRQTTRLVVQGEPNQIEECIAVMDGPPDASISEVDASEVERFRSSVKTAHTPHSQRQSRQVKPNTTTNPRMHRVLLLES
jgi:hypothetical protein